MPQTGVRLTQSGLIEYFGDYTTEMLRYLEDEAGPVPVELTTGELITIDEFIERFF
jgi:hypothetical protein